MKNNLRLYEEETTRLLKEMEKDPPGPGIWEKLKEVEEERRKILLKEEQMWHLKSRAIWLREGDKNTKFFHGYATRRKNKNSIWRLRINGTYLTSSQDIRKEAVNHFNHLFKSRESMVQAEQLWAIEDIPRMFDEEDLEVFKRPIDREEVIWRLKSLAKDKSPGSDGWTPDFFIFYVDLFVDLIVTMVVEVQALGKISGALNSTFLALISKEKGAETLDDYRPISLCNTLYKVISKIIAEMLKKVFSRLIYPEQAGFLKDRNIHNAVATTQEVIHSIH